MVNTSRTQCLVARRRAPFFRRCACCSWAPIPSMSRAFGLPSSHFPFSGRLAWRCSCLRLWPANRAEYRLMTEQLVLIVIGAVVAVFVLRPLLSRKRPGVRRSEAPPPGRVSDELSELELDHDMGRVNEEDYQRWRGELDR